MRLIAAACDTPDAIAADVRRIAPQIVPGALIIFTPREPYPVYSICGRAFTWLSPLRHQIPSGLIPWQV